MDKPAADEAPFSTGYHPEGGISARVEVPPATIAANGYLTPQDEFGDVSRSSPTARLRSNGNV